MLYTYVEVPTKTLYMFPPVTIDIKQAHNRMNSVAVMAILVRDIGSRKEIRAGVSRKNTTADTRMKVTRISIRVEL